MSLGLLSRAPDQVSATVVTLAAVGVHPRDPAAVLLAEDDRAARAEGLAVGGAGLLAQQLSRRRPGCQPVGPLGLDVLEQQRAVRAPERPFGELKAAAQAA